MDMEKQQHPPTQRCPGQPDGPSDVINKYGTYEVQRTAGQENEYPQIAAGLAKDAQRARRKRPTQQDGTRIE